MPHHTYMVEGNTLFPTDPTSLVIRNELEPAVYSIGSVPMRGWCFTKVDNFVLPPKLYGDTLRHADRIITTFLDRPSTTGVQLTGEKGSGKTMLAKELGRRCVEELHLPVFLVNTPFCGDSFNKLIQGVEQPAMLLFDEYEKVYDRNQQAQLLTLLDGTFSSKKLVVMTNNDKYRIDEHMRNRPGRLYYSLDFNGLDNAFVEEYGNDMLKDKKHVTELLAVASIFDKFNFDVLKAIVEEVNRYDESPMQVIKMLNARPFYEGNKHHDAVLVKHGQPVEFVFPNRHCVDKSPLQFEDTIHAGMTFTPKARGENHRVLDDVIKGLSEHLGLSIDADDNYIGLEVSRADYRGYDAASRSYSYFINDVAETNGYRLIFQRDKKQAVNEFSLF